MPIAPPLCSICRHLVQVKDPETKVIIRNTCKGQGSIMKCRKARACGYWKRKSNMVLDQDNLNYGDRKDEGTL